MIHELLFNLYHHPGVAIDDADWTHLFELPQFLHPGEEKLLQLIISVGMDYHKITSFTNEVLNQNCVKESGQNQSFQGGPYLTAFCNGIQEALGDYRKEIIKLENTFLAYPQLSLTDILSSVNKFKGLFDVLKSMIRKIQIEELHGCLLMSGLHQYIHCGIEQIEKSAVAYVSILFNNNNRKKLYYYFRIIKTINTVFYQHLCNWIVCGNLVDPYNEFFICDGKVADENFLYPEQLAEYIEQLSDNANSSYSIAVSKI
ncbi:unnamed protein product [Ceutorhynchus assimilis]|uniref:Gamma-tubulin complex component n=1 Tax=Ceutorhynchus assimilis TaxID=467358 RepID=A0A9N9MJZ4_9CUCU|nr:unnamed protein product [Ceutorhynchus assimilis]